MGPIEFTSVGFSIFGLEVAWYGVLIATAMILGIVITSKRAPKYGIKPDRVLDYAIICLPLAIIGARLYYVIFNWQYYSGDFLKIVDLRSGGLAIHGGLILGLGAALLLCKLWKIRPLDAMDCVIPSIALGQAIGRWGNYFNQEAYGSPTDLPWAIEVDGVMVHPTFLYESIWCFILFIVLMIVGRNQKFRGQLFYLYGILYSIERAIVEELRTDSLMFMNFKVAQLVSIAFALVCLVLYIRSNKKRRRSIFR